MTRFFQNFIKPIVSSIVAIALLMTLWVGSPAPADAASYGGRMGGGSFRSAPRSYSAPRSGGGYSGGGYNRGYGGGMGGGSSFFFFPSPWMFFGGGGGAGGILSLLVFAALASTAVQAFQRFQQGQDGGDDLGLKSSKVSVVKLQVGLLSEAKTLQEDLNRIAEKANTASSAGLAQALQETTLSLLRHPEYWAYAGGESKQSAMLAAESEFNRMILSERSKFLGESVSNVSGQLKQANATLTMNPAGELVEQQSGEYIVVTLLVGAEGKIELPAINSATDLRRALSTLGAVSSDRLLTLEVLWQPGSTDGVLTSDDMVEYYPTLKLV
jgi:uncharacterized membrane protein